MMSLTWTSEWETPRALHEAHRLLAQQVGGGDDAGHRALSVPSTKSSRTARRIMMAWAESMDSSGIVVAAETLAQVRHDRERRVVERHAAGRSARSTRAPGASCEG